MKIDVTVFIQVCNARGALEPCCAEHPASPAVDGWLSCKGFILSVAFASQSSTDVRTYALLVCSRSLAADRVFLRALSSSSMCTKRMAASPGFHQADDLDHSPFFSLTSWPRKNHCPGHPRDPMRGVPRALCYVCHPSHPSNYPSDGGIAPR